MASNFNKTDKKQTYLHHQIEKYVKFVNQIIYDEDFWSVCKRYFHLMK